MASGAGLVLGNSVVRGGGVFWNSLDCCAATVAVNSPAAAPMANARAAARRDACQEHNHDLSGAPIR
jgi:hypothetical protein